MKINEYGIIIKELKITNIIQSGEYYKFESDEKDIQKQKNDFEVYIIGENFKKERNPNNQLIPKYYTIYLVHKI